MRSITLAIEHELRINKEEISQQILSVMRSETWVSGANEAICSSCLQLFKFKSWTA